MHCDGQLSQANITEGGIANNMDKHLYTPMDKDRQFGKRVVTDLRMNK